MFRAVAVASFVALAGATLLSGCAIQSPIGVAGQTYAPYDTENNPACGALGNCVGTNPLRLNWTDLHGGGG